MRYADILIQSSTIYTGLSDTVFRGSVAITGKRIISVGRDSENDYLIGKNTKVYEYENALVMPGFNDAHVHLISACAAGDSSVYVDLSSCRSEEECAVKVEEYIKAYPDCAAVRGGGWNNCQWADSAMPSKLSLDRIASDRCVSLISWDCHSVWVNSYTLQHCGITRLTRPKGSGDIGLDKNGEPSGMLYESGAMQLLSSIPSQKSAIAIKDLTAAYLKRAASLGITSVGDVFPGNENSFKLYSELDSEDRLDVRIHHFSALKSDLSEAQELRKTAVSEKVRFCGLKFLTDGVAESHTAYMLEPYSDNPTVRGYLLADEALLKSMIINADREGFSVRLHTIGDAAVRTCLDIISSAREQNKNSRVRHSLEHVENIQPEDIQRLNRLGVIASMQPLHITSNIDGYKKIVGSERLQRAWAMKSIISSGAKYAFGSDAPVADINPIAGIHAAVTRTDALGYPTGGFIPSEKLTILEALKGYTYGSSYLEGFDDRVGTLEAGKLADITVLSRNLFDIHSEEILSTKVLLTLMDGRVTYMA